MKANQRLYRSTENRMIAGVAAGVARYMDIDPTIVRLIFIAVALAGGFGVLAYIVAWVIVPEQPTSETISSQAPPRERSMAGIFLVAIGSALLLQQTMGINVWRYIWPVGLIAIGLYIILRRS